MDIETVTSRFREAAAVGVVRLRAGIAIREASRYPAIRSLMLRNGWHAPLRFSACCRRAQPPIWRQSRSFDTAVRAPPNSHFCRSVVPTARACLPA